MWWSDWPWDPIARLWISLRALFLWLVEGPIAYDLSVVCTRFYLLRILELNRVGAFFQLQLVIPFTSLDSHDEAFLRRRRGDSDEENIYSAARPGWKTLPNSAWPSHRSLPGEEPLTVFPLALPMGWAESSPYFCTMPIAAVQLQTKILGSDYWINTDCKRQSSLN